MNKVVNRKSKPKGNNQINLRIYCSPFFLFPLSVSNNQRTKEIETKEVSNSFSRFVLIFSQSKTHENSWTQFVSLVKGKIQGHSRKKKN